MTDTANESPHGDGALGESGAVPALRKPWKTPTVITSAMSAARLGADAYEDGAIATNYRPS